MCHTHGFTFQKQKNISYLFLLADEQFPMSAWQKDVYPRRHCIILLNEIMALR